MLALPFYLLLTASILLLVDGEQINYHVNQVDYDDELQNKPESRSFIRVPRRESSEDSGSQLYFSSKGESWNCDRPWLWYVYPCVWLDFRYLNFTSRLFRNFLIACSTIGAGLCIGVFGIYCFLKFRYAGRVAKYEKIFFRYGQPGILRFSNGTTLRYEPTAEEQEALLKLHRLMVFAD